MKNLRAKSIVLSLALSLFLTRALLLDGMTRHTLQ